MALWARIEDPKNPEITGGLEHGVKYPISQIQITADHHFSICFMITLW